MGWRGHIWGDGGDAGPWGIGAPFPLYGPLSPPMPQCQHVSYLACGGSRGLRFHDKCSTEHFHSSAVRGRVLTSTCMQGACTAVSATFPAKGPLAPQALTCHVTTLLCDADYGRILALNAGYGRTLARLTPPRLATHPTSCPAPIPSPYLTPTLAHNTLARILLPCRLLYACAPMNPKLHVSTIPQRQRHSCVLIGIPSMPRALIHALSPPCPFCLSPRPRSTRTRC